MAVTTSGFQLSALPQAPRINAQDFMGAPQQFQAGLANAIKSRAMQLELADQQRKDEIAQATQPQRLNLELASLEQQGLNVPVLGQAQRAVAQQQIDVAPSATQAAIAGNEQAAAASEFNKRRLAELGPDLMKREQEQIWADTEAARMRGDTVIEKLSPGGTVKLVISRSPDGKEKLIKRIELKTAAQAEAEQNMAGLEAERIKAQTETIRAQGALSTAKASVAGQADQDKAVLVSLVVNGMPKLFWQRRNKTAGTVESVPAEADPATGGYVPPAEWNAPATLDTPKASVPYDPTKQTVLPNQEAVTLLKSKPDMAGAFDEQFGAGASAYWSAQ